MFYLREVFGKRCPPSTASLLEPFQCDHDSCTKHRYATNKLPENFKIPQVKTLSKELEGLEGAPVRALPFWRSEARWPLSYCYRNTRGFCEVSAEVSDQPGGCLLQGRTQLSCSKPALQGWSLPLLVAGAVGRGLREGEPCPTLFIVQSSRVSSRAERVSIRLLMCFEDVCGRNLCFSKEICNCFESRIFF